MKLTALRRADIVSSLALDWIGLPFEWGRADCALLAKDVMTRMGQPPAVKSWPSYKTGRGALLSVKRLTGGGGFEALCDEHLTRLGMLEPLRVGDVIGMKTADDDWPLALGVFMGPNAVLAASDGSFRREMMAAPALDAGFTGHKWGVR